MRERRQRAKSCWLDLFDKPHFQGRLQRHFAPMKLDQFAAASAIVGPDTRVEIVGSRGTKQVVLRLESNALIHDIKAWASGMKIRSASVLCESGKDTR